MPIETRVWANIEPPAKSIITSNFVFMKYPSSYPQLVHGNGRRLSAMACGEYRFCSVFRVVPAHQAGFFWPPRDYGMLSTIAVPTSLVAIWQLAAERSLSFAN